MKKILMFVFLSFNLFAESNDSINNKINIDLYRSKLSISQMEYIYKRGIGNSYKWDNFEANKFIVKGLKHRSASNVFFSAFILCELIATLSHIILISKAYGVIDGAYKGSINSSDANKIVQNASDIETLTFAFYGIGGAFLIPAIILNKSSADAMKSANYILNNR